MTPDQFARLHAQAFPDDRGWSAAEFADLLALPGAVVTGDARSFVLGRVTADEAEILTLATDPGHRRMGLAHRALAAFTERAAEAGAARVFLEVAADNVAALALYEAAGFTEIGRRRGYYARPGGAAADALVLALDLPATDSETRKN